MGEVWFALHGYRQAARRFARRFAALDEPGRVVVVPEALSPLLRGPGPGEARAGAPGRGELDDARGPGQRDRGYVGTWTRLRTRWPARPRRPPGDGSCSGFPRGRTRPHGGWCWAGLTCRSWCSGEVAWPPT